MSHQITYEITRTRSVTVSAPLLYDIVEVMLRAHHHPNDARARIQLGLIKKEGLNRCPSCRDELSVLGYRRTLTAFEERETIQCGGCRTVFSLRQKLVA